MKTPNDRDDSLILAIDFGGTKIAMAITSFRGEPLRKTEIPTHADAGAVQVMQRTLACAHALLDETRTGAGGVLRVVSVVTPGIVEPDGIRLAPNNPGWETLAMAKVLREAFAGAQIVVETDVKAAALAEVRGGALAGVDCGIYLNLGTGLASAAVIDGKVLRGAHGAAGEIGYQLRGVPGEVPFAAGGAPLENFISGRALADRSTELAGRPLTTREALAMTATDPRIAALVDEALNVLAVHVANMVLTLDPSRIAIGGGMARVPRIVDTLRRVLDVAVPYPPELVIAQYGHDAAPLQGAIFGGMDVLCRHANHVDSGHSA
ncbi:ROK family protein [Paraburkholderia sp. C35]|uniref:ROK family protein n=1 Tax=Paraburkholderia sp. C35 TaxID=2126993 RepID=UPI000D69B7A0|nr:ROK family protein [Paraburkholderia sp. C35]